MRAQAQGQAKMFIRTYPGAADFTVEDLRRKLNSDEKSALIQSIQRSIDWIPGLSPFWHRHRMQLTNMIEQLGSPHLFFTLSAADLRWPELHRLIEEQRAQLTSEPPVNIDQLNQRAAYDRRIDNLTRYPHIVASFLQSRVKTFLESLKQIPEFDYIDHWYRYEWQHRGSGHVHGFLWLKDGPAIDDKDFSNADHRSELAQYFAKRVFSHTPIPHLPRPAINPCQVSSPVDKDNRTDVAELLNRCQRHSKCLPTYCLRWNNQLRKQACRFGFLHPSCDGPKIEKNHKGQWTFYPFRPTSDNDLNRFHPLWIAMWRGNIDISPVLGKHAAINYIAKYAAKAESMSNNLDKTILDLTQNQPDTDGIGTIIAKTLNRFCIERDFSAQEACHQLLQLQMVECSRVFVTINLSNDLTVNKVLNPRRRAPRRTHTHTAQGQPPSDDLPADNTTSKSVLEGYMERSPECVDLSYYDMMKSYKWRPKKKDWVIRNIDAIVQIYPRKWQDSLKKDPTMPHDGQETSTFATAARRALMLYIPFRDISRLSDVNVLLDPNSQVTPYDPTESITHNNNRWRLCFLWHIFHTHRRFLKQLFNLFHDITENDFNHVIDPDDSDNEWDPTPDIDRRQELEWERAARLPLNGQRQMGQPWEFFGFRDIDLLHDWSSDLQQYQLAPDLETFIASNKRHSAADMMDAQVVPPEMLNPRQREIYDYLVEGFRLEAGHHTFNTVVMGTAGVGKSFLIRALESGIWQTAKEKYGEEQYPTIRSVVKLAAFTGKAAYQVGGVTIHSLLAVGNIHNPQPLLLETLRRLQRDIQHIHFLFLDEMSMIGLKLLLLIDHRLRELRPQYRDIPFGGVSVVLFGDFGQLPPVMDTALYQSVTNRSPSVIQDTSKLYYDSFTRAFNLTQQMRQQGQDEMDIRFQGALSRLRTGMVTKDDWEFFQSRVLSNLSLDDQREFHESIILYTTNDEVFERNVSMLERVGSPVARIEAQYHGISNEDGAKIDSEYCNGLEHVLHLSVGSRVLFYSFIF